MSNIEYITRSSERNFGITFSLIFFIISIYLYLTHNSFSFLFIILSLFILFMAIFYSKILYWPNYLWFKFGLFLGYIISPILLTLIFLIVVIPTGLLVKIFNSDIINKRIIKNKKSYWKKREDDPNPLKNQF